MVSREDLALYGGIFLVLLSLFQILGCRGEENPASAEVDFDPEPQTNLATPPEISAHTGDRLLFLNPTTGETFATFDLALQSVAFPSLGLFFDPALENPLGNRLTTPLFWIEVIPSLVPPNPTIILRNLSASQILEVGLEKRGSAPTTLVGGVDLSVTPNFTPRDGDILELFFREDGLSKKIAYQLIQGELVSLHSLPSVQTAPREVKIVFSLSRPAVVVVEIFAPGERGSIARLQKSCSAGPNFLAWDLRNSEALRVAPGIYFFRILHQTNEGESRVLADHQKIVLLAP